MRPLWEPYGSLMGALWETELMGGVDSFMEARILKQAGTRKKLPEIICPSPNLTQAWVS